jgi:hypothetical protein
MKLQIIETPDYILAVSDEEIKEGDWVYITLKPSICQYKTNMPKEWCKKITAYQPKGNAPELDLPLLPEITIENDVEKLAEQYVNSISYKAMKEDFAQGYLMAAFINGYKAATKTFSEDDLRKAIDLSRETLEYDEQHGWYSTMSEDEIIKSLKQPKTPKWFVAETRQYSDEELYKITEFKTTTINGKTYLVGTYLYE